MYKESVKMKVLIFSHISDIDGMGGVILAKLAYQNVDYVLTETFDLQHKIDEYMASGKIYDYDLVYVTDVWLEEPTLSKVANNSKLKDKFLLFDHHESAIDEGFDKYPFTTIRIKDELGLCSGTSLFYEYLIKENILKESKGISRFVELTRRYDTWEWKNIYNDEMAHELTLLFYVLGCDGYINLIYNKIKENNLEFEFNEIENTLINNKKKQILEKVSNYKDKIFVKEINGLKAGIVFIDYEYRNDLVEYLRNFDLSIDIIMMVAMDKGTISYRSISGVAVRSIAESFGGKGHDYAAASPISKEVQEKIINILTTKD